MSRDAEERHRAEQKARLVVFLKKIPLFSDFPTATLRKVLLLCSKVTLEEGETLCKECEESNSMYILLSGKLQVNIKNSDIPVATIEPVSSIGEMGVFTDEPRTATVTAIQKSALFCLKKGNLNMFINKESFMVLTGIALYIISSYFLIRLFWIKRFQLVVLLRSPRIYIYMPDLKTMMWKRFWVWDENSFLPDNVSPSDLREE